MIKINKQLLAKNFSKAASDYNTFAVAQKDITNKLLSYLPVSTKLKNILEFGCGTGFLTENLLDTYSQSQLTGIDIAEGMINLCKERFSGFKNAVFKIDDIEQIDSIQQFDLISSSSTIQWCKDYNQLFSKLYSALKPNGYFVSSVLITNTLDEFYTSYNKISKTKIESFFQREPELLESLRKNGFTITKSEIISQKIKYQSATDALRAINNIGAKLENSEIQLNTSPKTMAEILRHYTQKFSASTGVYMTYDSLLFSARKK